MTASGYVVTGRLIAAKSPRHPAGMHLYRGMQIPADTHQHEIARLLALGVIAPIVTASKSPRPRGAKAAEPGTLSARQRSDLRADEAGMR